MPAFKAADYQVLDPGTYAAVFDRADDSPEPGPFGNYTDWFFTVTTAEGPVEVSGRSSKPERLTRSTKARQWLEDLLGRPLAKDESIDTASLKGTQVMLTIDVKTTDVGEFNRIIGIHRVDASQPEVHQQPTEPVVDPEYAKWRAEREAEKAAMAATNAEEPPLPSEPPGDLGADES
jgi:hypothetical protein